MRTIEQMQADMQALCDEINKILNDSGWRGPGPAGRIAVFEKRPDLKKRWDDLMAEGRAYEEAHR